MSTSARVSVLLPSYNCAPVLDGAIASVVGQTHQDFELLVCDDSSTDDSYRIAQAWAQKDPRITVWQHPNAGVIDTLNALASRASGTYIAMLGANDRFATDRLARGVQALSADSRLVATLCNIEIRDDAGKPMPELQRALVTPKDARACRGTDLAQQLVSQNCLHAPGAMLRKAAADAIGMFARHFALVHGWDLWLRLSLIGPLEWRNEVGAYTHTAARAPAENQQKSTSYETLTLLEEIAPRVVEHYQLPETTWGQLHGVMAEHAIRTEQMGRALTHLATRAKHDSLSEREKIWLLQSLAATNRLAPARDLAAILHNERFALQPTTCQALDAICEALGWDLYADRHSAPEAADTERQPLRSTGDFDAAAAP